MKYNFLQEPLLEFGQSMHVCPREGISQYQAYDTKFRARRTEILIGAVGTSEGNDKLDEFFKLCSEYIPAKVGSKQPNLFTSFCGFNQNSGFKAKLIFDGELAKTISNIGL